jgi:predicted aspartyl protease
MNPQGGGSMGRFSVEIEIANYQDILRAEDGRLAPENVRQKRISGVVDTGATRLILPASVVAELGLPEKGKIKLRYADQRTASRPRIKDVWLKLQGRDSVFEAGVEPARTDALIGAIVLEVLDFVVDCTKQKLIPRDPKWIISEAE